MSLRETNHRYGWLLASLIAVYIITPMTGSTVRNDLFLELPLAILVGFCLFSLSGAQRIIAAVFTVPIVTTSALSVIFGASDMLRIVMHVFCVNFFGCVMLMHLRTLVQSRKINEDILAGSICIYLLFGLVFGFIYNVLNIFEGVAFEDYSSEPLFFSDFVYLSMVTLTTVGYGDIVPISPIARSLSTFQALLGQFYLAILVARFVGIYAANHSQSENNK